MSRSKTGRRIKVLKSSDTTYEVESAVRIKLRSHERFLSPFYVGDKIGGAFKRATFDLDMLISF